MDPSETPRLTERGGKKMDPDVTLKMMVEALDKEDSLRALEHAEELMEWILKGGAMPKLNEQHTKRALLAWLMRVRLAAMD